MLCADDANFVSRSPEGLLRVSIENDDHRHHHRISVCDLRLDRVRDEDREAADLRAAETAKNGGAYINHLLSIYLHRGENHRAEEGARDLVGKQEVYKKIQHGTTAKARRRGDTGNEHSSGM